VPLAGGASNPRGSLPACCMYAVCSACSLLAARDSVRPVSVGIASLVEFDRRGTWPRVLSMPPPDRCSPDILPGDGQPSWKLGPGRRRSRRERQFQRLELPEEPGGYSQKGAAWRQSARVYLCARTANSVGETGHPWSRESACSRLTAARPVLRFEKLGDRGARQDCCVAVEGREDLHVLVGCRTATDSTRIAAQVRIIPPKKTVKMDVCSSPEEAWRQENRRPFRECTKGREGNKDDETGGCSRRMW
jgi:hypothetical protein